MTPIPLRDLPLLPGANWLGHTHIIKANRLDFIEKLIAEGGDRIRVRVMTRDALCLNTARGFREVLVEKASSFEKSSVMRFVLYPLAGTGLFTSEGDLHRRQRRLMAPLFTPSQIGGFAEDMVACAERTIDDWQDGDRIVADREMTRITMSIAGKTLFDADTFDEADELGGALTTALRWASKHAPTPAPHLHYYAQRTLLRLADRAPASWTSRLRAGAARLTGPLFIREQTMRDAKRALDRQVMAMVAARRAADDPPRDLMTALLSAHDADDGSTMSDKQVRDEVLTLFVAGHETTATALSWALSYLARDPALYQEVQREVDAVGERPSIEDRARLPLCLAVFKEALRIMPPVYIFPRQTKERVVVDGVELEPGTLVFLSPYALHRRPDLYPEPRRFDPSRFTPETEARRPKGAYQPFGDGPRICIGNHFAYLEGQLVLATLLARARFELEDHAPVIPLPLATLRPKGGVPLRIRLRAPRVSGGRAEPRQASTVSNDGGRA